jgi:hypothetical protein
VANLISFIAKLASNMPALLQASQVTEANAGTYYANATTALQNLHKVYRFLRNNVQRFHVSSKNYQTHAAANPSLAATQAEERVAGSMLSSQGMPQQPPSSPASIRLPARSKQPREPAPAVTPSAPVASVGRHTVKLRRPGSSMQPQAATTRTPAPSAVAIGTSSASQSPHKGSVVPPAWDTLHAFGDLRRLSSLPEAAPHAFVTCALNPTPHPQVPPPLRPGTATTVDSATSETTDVLMEPLHMHASPLLSVCDTSVPHGTRNPYTHTHAYAAPVVTRPGHAPVALFDPSLQRPPSHRDLPPSSPATDNAATAALRTHLASLEATLGGDILCLYPNWSPGSHRIAVRSRHLPQDPTQSQAHPPWHALDLLVDSAAWAANRELVSLLWPPLATSAARSQQALHRDSLRSLVGLAHADADEPVTIERAVQAWQTALAYTLRKDMSKSGLPGGEGWAPVQDV